MRWFFALLILIGLVGCGPIPGITSNTSLSQPTMPGLAEALDRPPKETIETIGYLVPMEGGAALIGGLSFAHGEPQAIEDAGTLWLPGLRLISNGMLQLVQVDGVLSAPGSYGPDAAYPHQLEQFHIQALKINDLSIEQLLAAPGRYMNKPVRIQAQILISESSALLVESLGVGGVPDASAQQIKLSGPIERGALLEQLQASGNTHFGTVEVVGIWHGQSLYVLSMQPQ